MEENTVSNNQREAIYLYRKQTNGGFVFSDDYIISVLKENNKWPSIETQPNSILDRYFINDSYNKGLTIEQNPLALQAKKEFIVSLTEDLTYARQNLQTQIKANGWAGKSADYISKLWGSKNNIDEVLKCIGDTDEQTQNSDTTNLEEIKKVIYFEDQIAKLSKSLNNDLFDKNGKPISFEEEYFNIFGVKFNHDNINLYKKNKEIYFNALKANTAQKTFEKECQYFINNTEISDEIKTIGSSITGYTQTLTIRKDEKFNQEFNKFLNSLDDDNRSLFIEKLTESGFENNSVEDKYKMIRQYALSIHEYLKINTKASLKNKTFEQIQSDYENSQKKVFGENDTALTIVDKYIKSQELGSNVIKGIASLAVAIAAVYIGANVGTVAMLSTGTNIVVDVSDKLTSESKDIDDEYLNKILIDAAIQGATIYIGGSSSKAIQLGLKNTSNITKGFAMLGSDIATGMAADKLINGEISINGTIFNALFSVVGTTVYLKSIQLPQKLVKTETGKFAIEVPDGKSLPELTTGYYEKHYYIYKGNKIGVTRKEIHAQRAITKYHLKDIKSHNESIENAQRKLLNITKKYNLDPNVDLLDELKAVKNNNKKAIFGKMKQENPLVKEAELYKLISNDNKDNFVLYASEKNINVSDEIIDLYDDYLNRLKAVNEDMENTKRIQSQIKKYESQISETYHLLDNTNEGYSKMSINGDVIEYNKVETGGETSQTCTITKKQDQELTAFLKNYSDILDPEDTHVRHRIIGRFIKEDPDNGIIKESKDGINTVLATKPLDFSEAEYYLKMARAVINNPTDAIKNTSFEVGKPRLGVYTTVTNSTRNNYSILVKTKTEEGFKYVNMIISAEKPPKIVTLIDVKGSEESIENHFLPFIIKE